MKYKMLSVVIATALLSACGSSNDGSDDITTLDTQSQDGYIYNGIMKAVCGDNVYAEYTDTQGLAKFDDTKVTAAACTFTVTNNGDLSRDMDQTDTPWYGTMTTPTGQIKVNPFTSLLAALMSADDTLTLEDAFADLKAGIDSNANFAGFTLENILSDFSEAGQSDEIKELAVLANTVHQTNTQLANAGLNIEEHLATLDDVSVLTANAVSDPANLDKIIPITITVTGGMPDAPTAGTPIDKVTDEDNLPAVPTTPAPTGGTGGTGGGSDDSTGA